ncbi:MAG: class I SAM-dependent methyltransferase [Sporolactobacillus sp.]
MTETIRLSKRLQTVFNFIPQGARLADIGSDHAHLPCRAILDKRVPMAIAGEVRRGPLTQSQHTINAFNLANQISVRLGNGLDVIQPDEVDAIVLAGMGGELITDILTRGSDKLRTGMTLILQPNIRARNVRVWLQENGWTIGGEAIVEESPHFYEIICATNTAAREPRLTETELLMGPLLLREKNAAFMKKWTRRAMKLDTIIQSLARTEDSAELRARRLTYQKQLQLIQQALLKPMIKGEGSLQSE